MYIYIYQFNLKKKIRAFTNFNGHRSYQNRPIGVSAWGPNLNIYRDPRWGRNVEVPSEDPYHAGAYGVAYTQGLQWGTDSTYTKAIGALKHYTIYSVEAGRGSTYFTISAHDIEDTYLPQFKAPVTQAGSLGYMCSYAALTNPSLIPDGDEPGHSHSEPCCASKFFAHQKMRDEYGFKGYVQSDCGAVSNEYTREHWARNASDAAARAVVDGLMNSECGGVLTGNMAQAIKDGQATMADVEARVTRSLTLLMKAGLFDPPELQVYASIPFEAINSKQAQARNLDAARQGLVLLRNDNNTLPLRRNATIALIGPHAQTQVELAGNYFEDIGLGTCAGPACVPSLETALNTLSQAGANVTTVPACSDRSCAKADVAAAVAAVTAGGAEKPSAVVLALGIDGKIEGEGHDRMDIRLPGQQPTLASAVIAAARTHGIPVALLLFNGGMVALDGIDTTGVAVMECWYPGATGGTAVAETIFGLENRFGKLPFTDYTYAFTQASDFVNMNMTDGPGRTYKYLKNVSLAAHPFGFGLSYTTFALSQASIEPMTKDKGGQWQQQQQQQQQSPSASALVVIADVDATASETVVAAVVRVAVKNTGTVQGDEVVFLFHNASEVVNAWARRPDTDGPDPLALKQLVGYERVRLAPGESQTVTFNVTAEALSTVDKHGTRHILPGRHRFSLNRGHGWSAEASLEVRLAGKQRRRHIVSTMAGFSKTTGLSDPDLPGS